VTWATVAALGFAALLVAGLALDAAARWWALLPTAPAAVAASMRTTSGRVAVLATWVWLGVHFLAR
jgi:hypothetical protein